MPKAYMTEIDYSNLDSMTTEDLEKLLHLDSQAKEGLFPKEMVLYILDVVSTRKRENGELTDKTIEIAYKKFVEERKSSASKAKCKRTFMRIISNSAAVFLLVTTLVLVSLTSYAIGLGGFGQIAKWTADIFSFSEIKDDEEALMELKDEIRLYGAGQDLVPSWVPNGYMPDPVMTVETPKSKEFILTFSKGKDILRLRYTFLADASLDAYEKSDIEVEIFTVNKIAHYIFENNDKTQAVWKVDFCECSITGNVTKDEMKKIVQSIYQG